MSRTDQRQFVDFLIRVYHDGKMTPALDALKIGDRVLCKGPRGRFSYQPGAWSKIGMLAGGTGIAPMFQLLQTILQDPCDLTEASALCRGLAGSATPQWAPALLAPPRASGATDRQAGRPRARSCH